MSTTAKSDSITISSTIGTARRMTARLIGPRVGSPPVPRTACTRTSHQVSDAGAEVGWSVLARVLHRGEKLTIRDGILP